MDNDSKSLNTYVVEVLGCKVNQYDARQIVRLLEGFGLREAPACPAGGRGADLVVVHTCGVTATAVKKCRQTMHRMIRKNPDATAFLTGCAAAEEVIGELDGVDARITAGAGWIQKVVDELQSFSLPNPDFHLPENADELPAESFGGHTRAFLKIQDGCDANCAYCIVPQLRKTPRDKSVEAAVTEAEALVKRGYKEIVITGVHVGLYGRGSDSSLSDVLARIVAVPNIGRIRMSSLHPAELTDELLAVWAGSPNMMPHVHLSLQSGSDGVLERMGRGYTTDDYAAAVTRVRTALGRHKRSPQANGYSDWCSRFVGDFFPPSITTDVIVGFPGETDEEFEETFAFCKRIGFAGMHIFSYSPRPGTRAVDMPNRVDPKVAHARHQRLSDLAKEMTLAFNRMFIGQTVNVLVERCKEGVCSGGSEHYVQTYFNGSARQHRTIVPVRISDASADRLIAG